MKLTWVTHRDGTLNAHTDRGLFKLVRVASGWELQYPWPAGGRAFQGADGDLSRAKTDALRLYTS